MERVRRNGNSFHFSESLMDGYVAHSRKFDSPAMIPVSSSSSLPSSSSSSPMAVKYIEHRVSKMDTLAGVAIKYGVEVIGMLFLAVCFRWTGGSNVSGVLGVTLILKI